MELECELAEKVLVFGFVVVDDGGGFTVDAEFDAWSLCDDVVVVPFCGVVGFEDVAVVEWFGIAFTIGCDFGNLSSFG